jgi:hypothetical protein
MPLSPYEIATLRASIRIPHQPEWINRASAYREIPALMFRAGPDWAIVYHGSVVALTPSSLIALACVNGEFESPGYIPRILDPSIDPETVSDPALLASRRRANFEETQKQMAHNAKVELQAKRRAQLLDLEALSLDSLDRLSPLD